MSNNNLGVRVYPIDEPKGSTIAFASVAIDDLAAIRGIRIFAGSKGQFVAMPQSRDSEGIYHDIAFPLTADLRKEITASVLDEYKTQAGLPPDQRGYKKSEQDSCGGRRAEDVKLDVKVFPLAEPHGETLAFASVGFDDTAAIRGIRVISGNKGQYVSMPQSKDNEGIFHDVAFPLTADLRRAVSNAILADYRQQIAERKQSIGDRLAEGKEQAAQLAVNTTARGAAAKNSPGLEG